MSSRDISICDPAKEPQATPEIRICDEGKRPRATPDIRICDETPECPPDAPEFAYEVDSESNQMRVTSGQAPLKRILGTPCGTGQPGDEVALNQWVGVSCKCSTRIQDACGRATPPIYGDGDNPAPTLSGPDILAVGAVYTVSSGDPDFGWFVPASFTISEDTRSVTITDLQGSCGGTITATDQCGRSAFKAVTVGGVLTLSGTDAPVVGSQYSASGGKAPYTWSISCGAISDTGQVTSLSGCCGSGTVTVTDSCGQSVSIEVRFPTGQWVQIHQDDGECGSSDPAHANEGCWDHYAAGVINKVYHCAAEGYPTCTAITGHLKIVTVYGSVSQDGVYSGYNYWWVDATGEPADNCGCAPDGTRRLFAWHNTIYEWRCP
jgi:hypothetical protein